MSPIFARRRRPATATPLRVEPLEPRDVPAAPAATVFKLTPDRPAVGTVTTLPVGVNSTTADFAATGSLFVQTTTGVATVRYTGKTDTTFTGLTVDGTDPFGVGANDTVGLLSNTYPAVYQASAATFEFDFENALGLGSGTIPTGDIYFAMYWSSTGDPGASPPIPSFYYWNSTTGGGTGTYTSVSTIGNGGHLPTYKLAIDPTTHTAAVRLPYLPTNSARFVLGVGTAPTVPVVADGNGNLGVATLTPGGTSIYYDLVEFTLDANGVDPKVDGARHLPTLNVNTSQVDQFGFPLTLTGNANVNGNNVVSSVGVRADTPAVTRAAILSGFPAFLASKPSGAGYNDLLVPGTGGGPPLRITSPAKYLPAHPNAALRGAFDDALKGLFETRATPLSLTYQNTTYTGTPATATANGTDGQPHTYQVIRFQGTDGTTVEVFEPFFSTNGHPDRPPAPSWFNATQAATSAGQMVFGNEGVFADAGLQRAAGRITDAAVGVLGNLENQLVVALNRGLALKFSTTADWSDRDNFYPAGEPANLYAEFLHTYRIGGDTVFIDGKAYALAYDDQAEQNPSLVLLAQDELTVTVGGWISPQSAVPVVVAGAGAGGGPHVSVIDTRTGAPALGFFAFDSAVSTGVRVAAGDVNGDGVRDLVAGAAPGGGPHVKVFDGATGKVLASFFAFESTFTGGVYVAAGDLDGDGKAEVVVSAGSGGGPHVAVFDGTTGAVKANFFAYDPSFRGGATVAVGDIDGDGKAEVVTGAGPGGAPHVKAFDAAGVVKASFFAFDQTVTAGVFVAAGNIDGDGGGKAEVAVSAGPGGGTEVRVFDATSGAALGKFTPTPTDPSGGLRVGVGDVDGDGRSEVLAAAGLGAEPRVWVYDLGQSDPLRTFLAFDAAFRGGVWIDG